MRIHRHIPNHTEAHLLAIKRPDDGFKAGEFHLIKVGQA